MFTVIIKKKFHESYFVCVSLIYQCILQEIINISHIKHFLISDKTNYHVFKHKPMCDCKLLIFAEITK